METQDPSGHQSVEPQAVPQGQRRRTGGGHQAAASAAKPASNQPFQAAVVMNCSRSGANTNKDGSGSQNHGTSITDRTPLTARKWEESCAGEPRSADPEPSPPPWRSGSNSSAEEFRSVILVTRWLS